ncbi:phosphoesterase [Thiopseudomonas alkaliphila]|uniref:PHP domain-containing protein n=1 Tax=Thiopseudomonas alkaliphila TaxID=1697053 RepID=UPI00069DBAC1|nr:PHP domain-containing protein [Thiopseudomonas alkaliphila]AKX44134.1 phosphoesterase [Thiopseudomonas alkaliphila]
MDIDLHCHSTASDGVLSPTELVQRAAAQGVKTLALTDHDTIEGLAEAQHAAKQCGIQLINGIELSCSWNGATIHILGYAFDSQHPAIIRVTQQMHQARWERAELISQRLAKKGFHDALAGAQAIQAELGDSQNAPARPHFASFMVQQGWVKDYNEAFRKWLGAGKVGDVKQHWPSFEATLQVLKEAEALISLAHPYHYNFTRTKRRRLVADFVEHGGHAIEVVNGWQPAEQIGVLSILTREFGLRASAGSDFHLPKSWSELGSYRAVPTDLPLLSELFA